MPEKTNPGSSTIIAPTELIDRKIFALNDWRGSMLASLRSVIVHATSEVVEDWKWDTPVWVCNGIICTGEVYKKIVKLTFAKGALLADPAGIFNSSLEGKVRRAIDFHEGDVINNNALRNLIIEAIRLNNQ